MIDIYRKIWMTIIIMLNSICFVITAIKENIMYPELLKNSLSDIGEWNEILSVIWRYSEIGIIIVVAGVVLLYWIKRKQVVFLKELKISVGLFLTILIIEIVVSKLLNLPVGNAIQPMLWFVYIIVLLMILVVLEKIKSNKNGY